MTLTELKREHGRLQQAPSAVKTLKAWAVLRCEINNHLRSSRAYREINLESLTQQGRLPRIDRKIDGLASLLESATILHGFIEDDLSREEAVARAS